VGEAVTLYVDTSALVRRYLRDRHHGLVAEAMAQEEDWCASALARTEAQLALHRAAVSARQQADLWRDLRDEWDAFWVVPIDERCTARAVELGAAYGVRIVDAIHLAAADRLPGPVRYLTFERQQIPAADALGFEVISAVA
jgi:predicted nucleic acid-binding protein